MELFILLQESSTEDIKQIIILASVIFLLTPGFLLLYIVTYNRFKRANYKEKERMKLAFEAEILKSQIEVQEHTMQTIASELHDNIGQLLGLTSFTLGSVSQHPMATEQEKIETARELSVKAITELRQLAKLMQGEQLVETGLRAAIEVELDWLIRNGNLKVTHENTYSSFELGKKEKELVLFRVLQESINNVIKHAKASEVYIGIREEGGYVIITVRDNGVGFNMEEIKRKPKGLGLGSLEKRTNMLQGICHVVSVLGKGTTVNIKMPK